MFVYSEKFLNYIFTIWFCVYFLRDVVKANAEILSRLSSTMEFKVFFFANSTNNDSCRLDIELLTHWFLEKGKEIMLNAFCKEYFDIMHALLMLILPVVIWLMVDQEGDFCSDRGQDLESIIFSWNMS